MIELVQHTALGQEINDNIANEGEFENELLQSLQFEEQVKFQLNQLGKFIFEKKKILSLTK